MDDYHTNIRFFEYGENFLLFRRFLRQINRNEVMSEVLMPNTQASERVLVDRVSAGDKGAFNELFKRYHVAIYRYCQLMVGDKDFSDDLYQETFFTLYRACREGKSIHSVRGYLFSIARSRYLDHIERLKRSVPLDSSYEPLWQPDETASDTGEHLQQALSRIPDQYREAFVLFSLKEYSYDEISDILGVSKHVVKNRIFRAKQCLQKILGPILRDPQC